MICFFGGRGLAYTRESDRDMKLVAVADRKRKKPKVARLACLTLVNKKIWKREKEEIYFFIFCLKIRPFEATFFCDGHITAWRKDFIRSS